MATDIARQQTSPVWRSKDAWLAVAIAVAVRVILTLVWPADCYSCDMRSWALVSASTLVGVNPYVKTIVLNWPPMWMEILYGLGRVCERFDWPFFTGVRILLTGCDAVLVFSTFSLLKLLDNKKPALGLVLLGISLNPVLILLTIQHGNFDVIPSIGVVWFVSSLIRFRRSGDPVNWLLAAAWLGLATFAKTFPLVLAPLLIAEARRLPWKVRIPGAALCVGPTILSLAPLYVLNPDRISQYVIHYRGTPGPLGVSGLIQLILGYDTIWQYAPLFTDGMVIAMICLAALLWKRPLQRDSDLVLLAATILIAVMEFGTGNSPQYWLWFTPLLVAAYPHQPRGFRAVIILTAIVAVATNVLTFGFDQLLGQFMHFWAPDFPGMTRLNNIFTDSQHDLVLLYLPMTVVTFAAWIYACLLLLKPRGQEVS